jgi:protein TonB
MSPYRFILQNAKAPARKPQPAPAAAPAATATAAIPERPRPAPSRPEPAVAPQPAPEPVTASAPPPAAPVAEPAVAALSRKPIEPPPPKHDIIPIQTDEPHLPPSVLRDNPNGTVHVAFDINTDGSVGDVKVMSSNNRSLNRPTIDAVKMWKFEPVDDVLTVETEVVYKFDQ